MTYLSPMSAMPMERGRTASICGVGMAKPEAEDDVHGGRHALDDGAFDLARVGVVVENANELDLRVLGNARLVVGDQFIDAAIGGFVLADFGNEDGVFLLKQGLFHRGSSVVRNQFR